MQNPIDFVVTWLDATDPQWQKQYDEYKGITTRGDQSAARFRDWDLFKFWFRAVEKYAPWVNKVFLVTNGTFPKWISHDNPKLVLVSHDEYIPKDMLPTFNSCTIELNMNKIKGLSEHFVYFNDDCYINQPIAPEYYFMNGLPCDNNAETLFNTTIYNPVDRFSIRISMFTNVCVLNRHFNRREVWRQSKKRWFGCHLGKTDLITSLFLTMKNRKQFVGFNWRHTELPLLKSVIDEAWEKEPGMLTESCTRFREEVILNPYFFRYWQFASNRFHPVKLEGSMKLRTTRGELNAIIKSLKDKNITSLCINDTAQCSDEDFVDIKNALHAAFLEKFPEKSSFEI